MRTGTEWIILAFIWVFAAITHSMMKLQTIREAPVSELRYGWLDFLISTFVAGFSGIVFYLTASLFFTSFVPIALFTGIGGYLGADGLRKIAPAAQDFLINILSRK